MSLRDDILNKADLPLEPLLVPEWNAKVWVRGMTGAQRDSLMMAMGKGGANQQNLAARLVAYCCCDEAGNRLFTDADILLVNAKSSAALERICKVAVRLSGMGEKDLETAKGN